MRVTRSVLDMTLDGGFAAVGIGLTAMATWTPISLTGAPLAGPAWLLAILPVLIGGPLFLRRRAPLLMWVIVWAGIALQALVTHQPPKGPELVFVLCVGSYALAAHASGGRAVAGLAVAACGLAIFTAAAHQDVLGAVVPRTLLGGQAHGGTAFLAAEILAFWLAGVLVRGRRRAAALARHNQALQRQAEQAVTAERARIARELHDIVAHHLSVVVLQAAGARASGQASDRTLEKIENSGRQALTEMRRLLGMLREPDEEPALTPQPGLGELPALAESVRAAGLPVRLLVDGDAAALPAAVDVSAYRIVQEALTNVLKHAGSARAEVSVGVVGDALMIEVTDDGPGPGAADLARPVPAAGGRGLTGMRERVALFGGELLAGPEPGGGFAVRARLPVGGGGVMISRVS
ncbi:MAG TPA: sensor histidine kinase [Streptosporangiaceae bacterium]|nr:sensor histidine kinase [Streptosporangiaceae bacterium]